MEFSMTSDNKNETEQRQKNIHTGSINTVKKQHTTRLQLATKLIVSCNTTTTTTKKKERKKRKERKKK